jgi:(4-(4-[2-(gamma-L-glutamylamino)ethyl]phenoxymethyl)furan-2-yl)methanamine synthase
MTRIAGYDVGGAHLKMALLENGKPVAVEQFACPLWQGLDKLGAALAAARPLTAGTDHHAITMTGELSDLFQSRAEGVTTLVDRLVAETGGKARFWLGRRGFADAETARAHPVETGSVNFAATARIVAAIRPDALLVDMGSTTTDIVAIVAGSPRINGWTDAERLASGELVYAGLTRTSVMSVATRAPFAGRWQGLAREHLATMADVYRVLGRLPDGLDQHATADGRDKSVEESLGRLARLFGRDAGEAPADAWRAAAAFIAETELALILDGCRQVLSANPDLGPPIVVAAGIGQPEIANLAARLGPPCLAFGPLIGADGPVATAATHHAPAVAVARLLHDEIRGG